MDITWQQIKTVAELPPSAAATALLARMVRVFVLQNSNWDFPVAKTAAELPK